MKSPNELSTLCSVFFGRTQDTPPKTNTEPENEPLEEEIPMKNPSFLGSILVFGGVFFLKNSGPNGIPSARCLVFDVF